LAFLSSSDSTIVDSVTFYDDGSHNDAQAGDGIWGTSITPFTVEKDFSISISVIDLETTEYNFFYNVDHFTTIGPIVFDHYEITSANTDPKPGDEINLKLTLKNKSASVTVPEVKARIVSLDSFATVTRDIDGWYRDIASGETADTYLSQYGVKIADNCPGNKEVQFRVNISSKGFTYWTDKFSIFVHPATDVASNKSNVPTEFALHQNYPNPFNSSTTISYQLPVTSNVELTVYSITGQNITTLVSEQQQAGNHRFEWDAGDLASGVYFYRLVAKDSNSNGKSFVETKKLILLK